MSVCLCVYDLITMEMEWMKNCSSNESFILFWCTKWTWVNEWKLYGDSCWSIHGIRTHHLELGSPLVINLKNNKKKELTHARRAQCAIWMRDVKVSKLCGIAWITYREEMDDKIVGASSSLAKLPNKIGWWSGWNCFKTDDNVMELVRLMDGWPTLLFNLDQQELGALMLPRLIAYLWNCSP